MVQIPDKVDGDSLAESEIFKFIDEDTSTGSTTSSSETEIGEVTVPANAISNGILILAHCRIDNGHEDSINTIRIRVGESATATSNALVETSTHQIAQSNAGNNDDSQVSTQHHVTIHAWYTGATFTNENFVHVTGQQSGSTGGGAFITLTCDRITVFGF